MLNVNDTLKFIKKLTLLLMIFILYIYDQNIVI